MLHSSLTFQFVFLSYADIDVADIYTILYNINAPKVDKIERDKILILARIKSLDHSPA